MAAGRRWRSCGFLYDPIYTIYENTMVTHFCIDVSWLSSLRTQSHMVSSGVTCFPLREVSCWNRTCCLCPNSRPAHDWTAPLSCWISPVTGVEDESTFEWDWEIDRDYFTQQRLNWEHCTCGRHSHGYDSTANTVNRELFIHCRSNWASPSSFSAIPLWLWVAGQNEHSSGWWYGIVPYCITALIKKRYCKKAQCQPSNPSPDILSITFKTVALAGVFHRHKCVPGPQWQLRSTVSQQQSDSFIVIDYRRTRTFFWMRLQRFVFRWFLLVWQHCWIPSTILLVLL